MTDRSKFEQMLEHLINEDSDKARELFHQLVVEKSREIYENILSEDFQSLDDEEVDENFGFAEADDDNEFGGDATDDFISDVDAEDDDFGDDFGPEFDDDKYGAGEGSRGMGGDEEELSPAEQSTRIRDLEDEIADLRAEFEKIVNDEEGEGDEFGGDDFGGADFGDDEESDEEGDDEFGGDLEDEDEDEDEETKEESFMREYIEKVGGKDYTTYGKMGDDGDASAKSLFNKMKNDMGGTTANIVQGGESKGEGTKGGLLKPSTQEDDAGNVNVPGGKAGVKHLKKVSAPKGGDDGDKGAGSPLNGVRSRAK